MHLFTHSSVKRGSRDRIHCRSGRYSLEKYNKITSDLRVASLSTGGSEKYIQTMAIDSGNPITCFFYSQSPLISQEPSISSWVSLIRSQIFHINNIKQILSMITKVLMLRSIILISQNIHKTTTDPSTVKKITNVFLTGGRECESKVPDCTLLRSGLYKLVQYFEQQSKLQFR